MISPSMSKEDVHAWWSIGRRSLGTHGCLADIGRKFLGFVTVGRSTCHALPGKGDCQAHAAKAGLKDFGEMSPRDQKRVAVIAKRCPGLLVGSARTYGCGSKRVPSRRKMNKSRGRRGRDEGFKVENILDLWGWFFAGSGQTHHLRGLASCEESCFQPMAARITFPGIALFEEGVLGQRAQQHFQRWGSFVNNKSLLQYHAVCGAHRASIGTIGWACLCVQIKSNVTVTTCSDLRAHVKSRFPKHLQITGEFVQPNTIQQWLGPPNHQSSEEEKGFSVLKKSNVRKNLRYQYQLPRSFDAFPLDQLSTKVVQRAISLLSAGGRWGKTWDEPPGSTSSVN